MDKVVKRELLIELCYACKNAVYEDGLGLYEIRCKRDGNIYDENAWCENQEDDPNYPRFNPRIISFYDSVDVIELSPKQREHFINAMRKEVIK